SPRREVDDGVVLVDLTWRDRVRSHHRRDHRARDLIGLDGPVPPEPADEQAARRSGEHARDRLARARFGAFPEEEARTEDVEGTQRKLREPIFELALRAEVEAARAGVGAHARD